MQESKGNAALSNVPIRNSTCPGIRASFDSKFCRFEVRKLDSRISSAHMAPVTLLSQETQNIRTPTANLTYVYSRTTDLACLLSSQLSRPTTYETPPPPTPSFLT